MGLQGALLACYCMLACCFDYKSTIGFHSSFHPLEGSSQEVAPTLSMLTSQLTRLGCTLLSLGLDPMIIFCSEKSLALSLRSPSLVKLVGIPTYSSNSLLTNSGSGLPCTFGAMLSPGNQQIYNALIKLNNDANWMYYLTESIS